MYSLGKLKLHHQPSHLPPITHTHTSSSLPKQSSLSNPSFIKYPSIKTTSSSKSPTFITTKSSPLRFLKSTFITLITAAALLSLKSPSMAAPFTPPPQSTQHVTSEEEQERALEEHLSTHPTHIDSLRSLAEVKFRSRKLSEAAKLINRLIKLEPGKPEWPVKKAKYFLHSGYTEAAITGFEEVLAKHPLHVKAYHGLVVAYTNAGLDRRELESRIEEAMLRCKKEEDKVKEYREFKHLVAQILVVRGEHSEALKLYQELVEDEPSDFWPYFCQGVIYTLLEEEDKAVEQHDKFKRLVPENYNYIEDFLVNNLFAGELFRDG